MTEVAAGIRCSSWSRDQDIDPIGTAGSYAGYLLVSWPLPWPRDMGDIEGLAPVREAVAGAGIRIQGLVPEDPATRRIVLYRRPAGAFTLFEGRELVVDTGADLGQAAATLLAGGGTPVAGRDVLLCTHGRRDRCCGSLGTELWQRLSGAHALPDDSTLSRTSHTGGHRFAPTSIVLPEGTVWGYLDMGVLHRVVKREGPVDDMLPHYRGCAGLDSPAVQALERAVLAQVGWSLFDCARTGEELGAGRVRLTVEGPQGTTVWEATVTPGRTVPIPDCGSPIAEATKSETELSVSDVTQAA